MGILDRVNMIVKSNVNDFLDKAANPKKDLDLYIYDMGDGIKEAEQGVQDTLVQVKMLENNAKEARNKAAQWEQRAEQAVKAGRDDLATEALRQQRNFQEEAANYEAQYAEHNQIGKELRVKLDELRLKYDDLQRNKVNLLARYEMAKTAQKVTGTRDPLTGLNQGDLSRMERKINAEQIRADMDTVPGAAAEAEIDKLAGGDNLDDELAVLKEKMGLNKKP